MKLVAQLGLVLLAITACQSGPGPSPPDILIASDFPTTDPGFSIQAQQAVQLAIDQYGHIGHFKVGYLPFDDHLGHSAFQAKGIQNVKHMIADARVLGMIGPWTSNMAYAEIPRANPSDLVMVSPTNTSDCITRPSPLCRPGQPPWQHFSHPNNYFRIAAPDSAEGTALARYLYSLGKKRVAAFNEFGDEGELFINQLRDELVLDGGKLVLKLNLDDGTTSFKTFLDSAKAAGADSIFSVGATNVCTARNQMMNTLPGAYFVGVDAMVAWSGSSTEVAMKNDQCIKDALGNADGMITAVTDFNVAQNTDAATTQAVAALRKAYPRITDIQTYVFAAYDCARLLIEAISRAVEAKGGGIPTRAEVISAVAQAHFEGVTGNYSFDAHGDALSPMMSIYRVDNGRWALVKSINVGNT